MYQWSTACPFCRGELEHALLFHVYLRRAPQELVILILRCRLTRTFLLEIATPGTCSGEVLLMSVVHKRTQISLSLSPPPSLSRCVSFPPRFPLQGLSACYVLGNTCQNMAVFCCSSVAVLLSCVVP